jgi:hypothetical protein
MRKGYKVLLEMLFHLNDIFLQLRWKKDNFEGNHLCFLFPLTIRKITPFGTSPPISK